MKAWATLFAGCLIAQVGWAQDAWLEFRAQHRPQWKGAPGWMLAMLASPKSPLPWDETMVRLIAGNDLDIPEIPVPSAAALALLKRESLPTNTLWVLLSPEGDLKASGSAIPTGEQLMNHLQEGGLVPSWERLEAFLREHPDNGEARSDALRAAITLALARLDHEQQLGKIPMGSGPMPERLFRCQIPDTEAGNSAAIRILEGVQAPLDALLSVPGWTSSEQAHFFTLTLWLAGAGQIPQFQESLKRMRDDLVTSVERGEDGFVAGNYLPALGDEGCQALLGLLRSRWLDPDQPWPSPNLFLSFDKFAHTRDPLALLKGLETLVLPGAPPVQSPENWKSFTTTRNLILQQRIVLSAKLERWESATSDLKELRRISGRRWGFYKSFVLNSMQKLQEHPQLKPILELPPLPDTPIPPPPPPLRLVLVGDAPWLRQWFPLKDSAPLAAWEPSELRWEVADKNLAASLRARQGWDATPRWALLRAETVLISGLSCPTPEALATHLASQGPSRYHRLSTYLEHHPDHQDIRRKRVAWIRTRLPNPALETIMVEDAKILKTGINLSPTEQWTPDVKLWQDAAQRTLPEIENLLHRWPSNVQAWHSWLAWSRLHPSHPSAHALAQRIHLWRNREVWASALPKDMHLSLAEDFRKLGRFKDMRAWFQSAWDGLRFTPYARHGADSKEQQEWEESIIKPLREALKALRREAELLALDHTWAMMQGKEKAK